MVNHYFRLWLNSVSLCFQKYIRESTDNNSLFCKHVKVSGTVSSLCLSIPFSSTMDCIIFLYLGVALLDLRFSEKNYWYPGFIVWTLVLCLLVRFVGVYILTYFTNRFRMKRINLQEQFIMAYGGLRGGVGFSLVKMIQREVIPVANMFVTTVLMVVMSTVWIQGDKK